MQITANRVIGKEKGKGVILKKSKKCQEMVLRDDSRNFSFTNCFEIRVGKGCLLENYSLAFGIYN